jgi:hypothetical protein
MRRLQRAFCGIVAAAAAAGCASSTEPVAGGIISAHVEQAIVMPGYSVTLVASRRSAGNWYVNRCRWYLQRFEVGGWRRSSVQPSPCEGSWVEVAPGSSASLALTMPSAAWEGTHRIELVVTPLDYSAGPVITVAPLEESTVVSNAFWIPTTR